MTWRSEDAVKNPCGTCDGTGCGPCANCGDRAEECACEDPEETDCDVCDGTGSASDDPVEYAPDEYDLGFQDEEDEDEG